MRSAAGPTGGQKTVGRGHIWEFRAIGDDWGQTPAGHFWLLRAGPLRVISGVHPAIPARRRIPHSAPRRTRGRARSARRPAPASAGGRATLYLTVVFVAGDRPVPTIDRSPSPSFRRSPRSADSRSTATAPTLGSRRSAAPILHLHTRKRLIVLLGSASPGSSHWSAQSP